jgi:hypothetical protein
MRIISNITRALSAAQAAFFPATRPRAQRPSANVDWNELAKNAAFFETKIMLVCFFPALRD